MEMKSLNVIQKTLRVFKTLAVIDMIVNFVGAACALVALIVFSRWSMTPPAFLAELFRVMDMNDIHQTSAILLADVAACCLDGLLLANAVAYLKAELADGTPFTQTGADKLRRLGVLTIVLPLVSICVRAAVFAAFGQDALDVDGNAVSALLGVCLIVGSLVCRYGAELRESSQLTVD